MIKKALLFSFTLLLFISCRQEKPYWIGHQKPPKTFTGTWIESFNNSNTYISQVTNGKKEGISFSQNKNNNISFLEFFKNNKRHGKRSQWFPHKEKKLYKEEFFINGLRNGPCTEWNLDGTIKTKGIYKNGNQYHGTFNNRGFDSNNNYLEKVTTFDNGKQIMKKGDYKLVHGKSLLPKKEVIFKAYKSAIGCTINLPNNYTVQKDDGQLWALHQSDGHITILFYTYLKENNSIKSMQSKCYKNYQSIGFDNYKEKDWSLIEGINWKGSFIFLNKTQIKDEPKQSTLFIVAKGNDSTKTDSYIAIQGSKSPMALNKEVILHWIKTFKSP